MAAYRRDRRGGPSEETEELEYRAVDLGRGRRAHLSVAKNRIGVMLRVGVSSERGRTTVIVPSSAARRFVDSFCRLADHEATLPAFVGTSAVSGGGGGSRDDRPPLKSERLDAEARTLFLDLRENEFGRFVRVSAVRGPDDRVTVFFPGDALPAVAEALRKLADLQASAIVSDAAGAGTAVVTDGRRVLRVVRGSNSFGEYVSIDESATASGRGRPGGGRGRGRAGGPGAGDRGGGTTRVLMSLSMARSLHAKLGELLSREG